MNKVREANMVLGVARDENDEANDQFRLCVPKLREGAAHQRLGPLDWSPEYGRMYVLSPGARAFPW